jgi:hypothetical protein
MARLNDYSQHGRYSLILAGEPSPCFWCGRETFLIDLDYQGSFCGRPEDQQEIGEDLRKGASNDPRT